MTKTIFSSFFVAGVCLLTGCGNGNDAATTPPAGKDTATVAAPAVTVPDAALFKDMVDGKATALFVLKNKHNMSAAITNYGARVVSLIVPDKNGVLTDVADGYDSIGKYVHQPETYFGAIVGRYGNRIAKGKFKLEGKSFTLATNNGANHLHGGKKGFGAVVWDGKQLSDTSVQLHYISKDMEEGYPGTLQVTVTYRLTDNNELAIDYLATTDKPTVLNLTNHTYFNLNGQGSGTINNHLLTINSDGYTPVDATLIPTGKVEPVSGTPFDFHQPTAIGSRIDSGNMQIKFGKGYDHNFMLNPNPSRTGGLNQAATVVGDQSGIFMEVWTLEPGVQFYGGNFMTGSNPLKGGKKDDFRTAFCLETQHFPDSPNEPSFPSTELTPDKQYKTKTVYKFSVRK